MNTYKNKREEKSLTVFVCVFKVYFIFLFKPPDKVRWINKKSTEQ